ncbi:MAG: hypothetical protein LBF68_03855 [Christensenellaceae bacterium]|nr:hypothetical protein [Christensenellaceae bacterium]
MKFCLIGRSLGHSYSPKIHRHFGYTYDIVELEIGELERFVKTTTYDGFNVTIPYKLEIMKYLDCLDRSAIQAGSVNTVIKSQSGWIGFNTDVKGLDYLVCDSNISLTNKKVIIFGSGGTSKTACTLASIKGASEIVVVSRNGINNYNNLKKHFDAEIIINTTPVGMYPNNMERLVDISNFSKVSGVIDVIYNPTITDLIFQARSLNINCSSGLKMLVAQAKYARDLFLKNESDNSLIENIYSIISMQTTNIVLIGMPSCGKSLIGRKLASILNREFVDTDTETETLMGISIPDAFNKHGEAYFRESERYCIDLIGKRQGLVIATGGGAVFNSDCYKYLKQNGVIVLLTRDLSKAVCDGRPLLRDKSSLVTLFNERFPKYQLLSDTTISNDLDPNKTIQNIMRWLNEYYNN